MKLSTLPALIGVATAMKQSPVNNGTLPEKDPAGAEVCRKVADFSIKDMREAASAFNHTATLAMSSMSPEECGADTELLSLINDFYLEKTDSVALTGRLNQTESEDEETRQTAVSEFATDYTKLAFTDTFLLKPVVSVLDTPVKEEHGEDLLKSSERIKNDSFHLMSASACIADHVSR